MDLLVAQEEPTLLKCFFLSCGEISPLCGFPNIWTEEDKLLMKSFLQVGFGLLPWYSQVVKGQILAENSSLVDLSLLSMYIF